MARIVYLFGAGASVGCIPAVLGMNEGFVRVKAYIGDPLKKKLYSEDHHGALYDLEGDLAWLIEIEKNRASIDTVARSFHLQGNANDLRKLKIALSAYLLLEQAEKPVDKRYDLFLASILENSSLSLPDEIKVLSWNYDNQFELGFNGFMRQNEDLRNRKKLKMIDKFSQTHLLQGNPFIYKLNGSAGLTFNRKANSEGYPNDLTPLDIIRQFASLKTNDDDEPGISFAWESPQIAEERLPPILIDCEIIVTIGYSFPFFNRGTDKLILNESKHLRKIYIQDPNAAEIEEKLKNLINPSKRQKIKFVRDISTKEFLIPYEL